MKDCSLVTIVNCNEVYEAFLVNLKTQVDVDLEVIPVRNPNNSMFSSARKALQYGAIKATGEYLIFIHPDVRFLSKHALYDILQEIKGIPAFGVIGVAGCPAELVNRNRVIYSSMLHGENKKRAGIPLNIPIKVQTVDECLFVQRKEYFDKVGFTHKEGWHLYAVEQCLRAEQDGFNNYVVPSNIWHISDGKSLDPNYVKQISLLTKEYSNEYAYINTTVKKWKTKGFFARAYLVYYYYKQVIKKWGRSFGI